MWKNSQPLSFENYRLAFLIAGSLIMMISSQVWRLNAVFIAWPILTKFIYHLDSGYCNGITLLVQNKQKPSIYPYPHHPPGTLLLSEARQTEKHLTINAKYIWKWMHASISPLMQ